MYKKILGLMLWGIFHYQFANSATCTATTGNWSAAGTWSCGHTPACGDSLVIPAGITVTVDDMVDLSGCASPTAINIYGTLQFATGKKMKLPCGSVIYVQSTGSILPGSGGGNSNYIEICGTEMWTAAYGPVYGPMIIACCNPLPVELVSFAGNAGDNGVQLSWATASETNNDYFTIYRSVNGLSYAEIGRVDGAGTSSSGHSYSFIDNSPVVGTNYYRLRQTDLNGVFKEFTMIAVQYDSGKNGCVLSVTPNPCTEECTISFTDCPGDNDGTIQVEMFDANGIKVSSIFTAQDMNGAFSMQIDNRNNLKPGIYIVRATSSKKTYQQKAVLK